MTTAASAGFNRLSRSASPWGRMRDLVPVPMDEPFGLPNLETSADVWHVYPMGVLYSGLIVLMLGVDSIDHVIRMIDEVNLIVGHNPLGVPLYGVDQPSIDLRAGGTLRSVATTEAIT